MNPLTRQPWTLSEKARGAIQDILKRDRYALTWSVTEGGALKRVRYARTLNGAAMLAHIDLAAGDYQRRLRLWEEIEAGVGPTYDRVQRRAQRGGLLARSALAAEEDWQLRRGRGRGRLTREKPALMFALAREWPNGLTLSPKSSFVRVFGIVLADCGTPSKNPYLLAERITKAGVPPVYRLEPTTVEGFRAE